MNIHNQNIYPFLWLGEFVKPDSRILIPVLLFLMVFLISGCSFINSGPNRPAVILNKETSDNNIQAISLDEAIRAFKSDDFGRMDRAGNYSVYNIYGKNIDSSGNAKYWIFAVKTNTTQFYFDYSYQNSKMYPWVENISDKPILIDQILMPSQIFSLHKKEVTELFNQNSDSNKDLQIRNGEYILTISGKSPNEYLYNAYSGENIS